MPEWLRRLVAGCTEPTPEARTSDVETVLRELEAHQSDWQPSENLPPSELGAPPPLRMPTEPTLRPVMGAPRLPPLRPNSRTRTAPSYDSRTSPAPGTSLAQTVFWSLVGVLIGLVLAGFVIYTLESSGF